MRLPKDAQAAALLDTRSFYETPEGVELSLSPASFFARGAAWAIDLGLRGVFYTIAATVLGAFEEGGTGILLILMFLTEWGYPVFFELRRGATPGKHLIGLRVVHADGSPIEFGSSVLRNLIRFVDFLPAGYLLGFLSCAFTDRFQRLGDLAAGTLVVHSEDERAQQPPDTVTAMPPQVPLSLSEQRAIVAFATRAAQWTEERQAELAAHSGSSTQGAPSARVAQLKAYARWIAGAR